MFKTNLFFFVAKKNFLIQVVLEWFRSESTLNFVVERASRALVFEGPENVAYTQQQHVIFTFALSGKQTDVVLRSSHSYLIRCVRCLTARPRLTLTASVLLMCFNWEAPGNPVCFQANFSCPLYEAVLCEEVVKVAPPNAYPRICIGSKLSNTSVVPGGDQGMQTNDIQAKAKQWC